MLTFLLASALAAPLPVAVASSGDRVPGGGTIRTLLDLAIDNDGNWQISVEINTSSGRQSGVITPNGLLARTGLIPPPLTEPISSFVTLDLDNQGHRIQKATLFAGMASVYESVFIDRMPVLIDDAQPTAPGAPPGMPFAGFETVRLSDSGTAVVLARISDPAAPTLDDHLLLELTPNGVGYDQRILAGADMVVAPGHPTVERLFGTNSLTDLDNHGHTLFGVRYDAPADADHGIYLDDTLVAVEGQTAPFGGTYTDLVGAELALNDHHDVLFRAGVDDGTGTRDLIVFNDEVVAFEGMPAQPGTQVTGFGFLPVLLGNNRNMAWFAEWNAFGIGPDAGIFVNGRLVLAEGDMIPGFGRVADISASMSRTFRMSDNGRWLLVRVTGPTRTSSAVLKVDLAGEVNVAITPAVPGQLNTFAVANGVPGHPIAVVVGTSLGSTTIPCGLGTLDLGIAGATLLSIDPVDDMGQRSFDRVVPAQIGGATTHLRAVDMAACALGPMLTTSW